MPISYVKILLRSALLIAPLIAKVSSLSNVIFENFKKGPPLKIEEELGTSPTFNYRFFDPLGLANDENFAIYREAELKHGRVAMMATIGMVFPESIFSSQWFKDLSQKFPTVTMTSVDQNEHTMALDGFQGGTYAIRSVPYMEWIVIFALVGYLETRVFVQQSDISMPGDYGTGYFGVTNKGMNERSLLAELENGRLAMLAFVCQVVVELWCRKSLISLWH